MLHDAQLAAGFQDIEKVCKGGTVDTAGNHAVGIAEGHHAIDTAGVRCADGQGAGRLVKHQRRYLDPAVNAFVTGELLFESFSRPGTVAGLGIAGIVVGGNQFAVVAQVGRQNFRVPAAAWPDLHHGVIGLDVEQAEGLEGVAILVALDIGRRAVFACDGLLQFPGIRVCREGHSDCGKHQSDAVQK